MQKENNPYRFLFAGGGTGGHLFPAIAVAEKIKELKPEAEFLFVGNKEKLEATIVPSLGFNFKPIWIKGFVRKFSLENILFPLKLVVSIIQSFIINNKFSPRVAVGSGGYVSGPAVWVSSKLGAKVVLLEQNSFPGVTTRILEKYADEIHVSFEDTLKYLKNEKSFVTGNPVRSSLKLMNKIDALNIFNLDQNKKTILIIGGSLGAGSINEAMEKYLDKFIADDIQIIWQTGKYYYEKYKNYKSKLIWVNAFIEDMSAAFSACDLLICRGGATTIAEITNLGIPSVIVPSPNVAANHQLKNAKSLSDKNAAILLTDEKVKTDLYITVKNLIIDEKALTELSENSKKFAKPDAVNIIAENVIKLAELNNA